nr:MAG TPA: hypothetical protein [Caudoviricetes sp.]
MQFVHLICEGKKNTLIYIYILFAHFAHLGF